MRDAACGDADALEQIFRDFVRAEGIAEALLKLALADGDPPLIPPAYGTDVPDFLLGHSARSRGISTAREHRFLDALRSLENLS